MVRGRNFNRYFIDFENDPKYIEYDRKLLHRPREERLFTCPRKLLIRQTGDRIISTIDLNKLYAWKSVFVILSDENKLYLEYLLALLNSSTINYYYQKIVGEGGRVFAQVKGINLDKLPIKIIPVSKQILFKEKVDLILKLNLELKESLNKFQKRLKTDYNLLKLSSSIENFYDLSPSDFFSELKKLKIELKAVEKDDLQEYFESHKNKILTLKSNIDKTDKEIDQMVYELYGLTNEEIKIVEAN
jgi:hypothetical protein